MTAFAYPRFFAHRGGGALAPENTLAGIALAARLGYQAVEFDAMLSLDGVPVLMHDETLSRTSDGEGELAQHRLSELRELDAGSRFHAAFKGTTIPTLAEALELCDKLNLIANVEIKPSRGREEETGTAVARVALAHRPALLSSFAVASLHAARRQAPDLPRAMLFDRVPIDWPQYVASLGCSGVHCASRTMTEDTARTFATAGMPWACFTVNDPREANRLFEWGASALFTDRLDLFHG